MDYITEMQGQVIKLIIIFDFLCPIVLLLTAIVITIHNSPTISPRSSSLTFSSESPSSVLSRWLCYQSRIVAIILLEVLLSLIWNMVFSDWHGSWIAKVKGLHGGVEGDPDQPGDPPLPRHDVRLRLDVRLRWNFPLCLPQRRSPRSNVRQFRFFCNHNLLFIFLIISSR